MLLKNLVLALLLGVFVNGVACAQTIESKVNYIGVSRHVKITGLMSKEVNSLINLQVEISNTDYDDQTAYYRLIWVDQDGFSAWEEEAWKPILLHGNQKRSILIVAPTAKARDFKIEFSGERNWAENMKPNSNQ